MFTLSLSCDNCSYLIESDVLINVDDEQFFRKLVDLAGPLKATAKLEKFDVKRRIIPTEWDYSFQSIDGRKWEQIISITPTSTKMNFSVSDMWGIEEFVSHRTLRDHCIEMIRTFGIERIKVRWVPPVLPPIPGP